jgi:hypothetical protein
VCIAGGGEGVDANGNALTDCLHQCRMAVVEGVGRFPYVDRSAEFAHAFGEFLRLAQTRCNDASTRHP